MIFCYYIGREEGMEFILIELPSEVPVHIIESRCARDILLFHVSVVLHV